MRIKPFWAGLLVVFLSLGSSCVEESESGPPGDVITTLPSCTGLSTFGNGALCLDPQGVADLDLCGKSQDTICTQGRLCFDTVGTRSCQCKADGDCAGFTAYVNDARAKLGQLALTPHCLSGACAGDVDVVAVDSSDTSIDGR